MSTERDHDVVIHRAAPAAAVPPRLDRSRHVAAQVLDHLRDRIIGLELAPGMLLARAELAAGFGVSQTPVRDALMRLEEEGLVDVFPQHKTVVSRIDIRSALQAHFLRRSIEVEVARMLATHPDAELVKGLRALITRQRVLLKAGDFADFSRTDQAFHRRMYEAAHVPDLWETVRRHSGHIDRLRNLHLPQPGKGTAILRDHARIVDAIAHGEPDIAEQRVREHLSGTLSQVEAIRARHPDYVMN